MSEDESQPWWHQQWDEKGDKPFQRTLRRQQTRWKAEVLGVEEAGGRIGQPGRLVSTMLPEGMVGPEPSATPNLMTGQARRALDLALERMRTGTQKGILQVERVQRNTLSSQPLCFNLFGHLAETPDALLPWVTSIVPEVARVREIVLEWAPGEGVSGSAFDAFLSLDLRGGGRGFVGVETKYHEDLTKSQRSDAPSKYREWTEGDFADQWTAGAAEALDAHGLRQLWYNQLLVQRVQRDHEYDVAVGVVLACAADTPATAAVETVRGLLSTPEQLRRADLEDVVSVVAGHDEWREMFWRRYLAYPEVDAIVEQRRAGGRPEKQKTPGS